MCFKTLAMIFVAGLGLACYAQTASTVTVTGNMTINVGGPDAIPYSITGNATLSGYGSASATGSGSVAMVVCMPPRNSGQAPGLAPLDYMLDFGAGDTLTGSMGLSCGAFLDAINSGTGSGTGWASVTGGTGRFAGSSGSFPSVAMTLNIYAGDQATATLYCTYTMSGAGTMSTPPSVTVDTSPSGLAITVDSRAYTAPASFTWSAGSTHTIATSSPQSGATGTQYVFAGWSDGGGQTHTVTAPSAATSYVASFTKQYMLTMNAGTGGGVSPSSGYHNAGSTVSISATPNSGYVFTGWTGTGAGSWSGKDNPCTVTMNGPIQETAAFTQPAATTAQTFILSDEASGHLVTKLLAAGYGNMNLYQTLVQIRNDT